MKRLSSLLLIVPLILSLVPFPVYGGIKGISANRSDKKVALVIGNNDYQHAPKLTNAGNDASLISKVLKTAGFEVVTGTDLTQAGMEKTVRKFREAVQGAEVGWIHYSGGGIESGGVNYLAGIDCKAESVSEYRKHSISSHELLKLMDEAEVSLKVLVIDSCRDNPFFHRRGNKGLKSTPTEQLPEGSVIAYATGPGDLASDGQGDHSPFSAAIAKALAKPDLDVHDIFRMAGKLTHKATKGRQTPWMSTSFYESFVILPKVAAAFPVEPESQPGEEPSDPE